MSDDKVTHIVNDETVGVSQLEGFDSQGEPGPGVTLESALKEVKRLVSQLDASNEELCIRTMEVQSLQRRLDAVRDLIRGDWGINASMTVDRIIEIIDPRPSCKHVPDISNPDTCVHCGDSVGDETTAVDRRGDVKIEQAGTEFNAGLMGTDAALTRRVSREELESEYGAPDRRGPSNQNIKPGERYCAVCEKPIEEAEGLRCDCAGGSDEIAIAPDSHGEFGMSHTELPDYKEEQEEKTRKMRDLVDSVSDSLETCTDVDDIPLQGGKGGDRDSEKQTLDCPACGYTHPSNEACPDSPEIV